MSVRNYKFEIKSLSPLLTHHDDINWADQMDAWRKDPANSKLSKAGDDRTPSHRWIGNLYHDGSVVSIPAANLSRALMEGAAMVPTGKGQKTFKSQSQSGMSIADPFMPLLVNDQIIPMSEIEPLLQERDFQKHMDAANALGFQLFIKRAKVGTSKHVRVRPRFNSWSLRGVVQVWDDEISERALSDFFTYAGAYKGLGDWRPGGKTPGSFGRFSATVKPA